jgi:hypothetical protein
VVRPQWHSPTRNDSHYSTPCDSSSHGSPRLERGGLGICEGLPIVQRSPRMICRDVRVGSQRCGSVYCKSPCIMVEKTSIFLPIVGGERWTGEHSDHRTWRSFVYLFGAFCFTVNPDLQQRELLLQVNALFRRILGAPETLQCGSMLPTHNLLYSVDCSQTPCECPCSRPFLRGLCRVEEHNMTISHRSKPNK